MLKNTTGMPYLKAYSIKLLFQEGSNAQIEHAVE